MEGDSIREGNEKSILDSRDKSNEPTSLSLEKPGVKPVGEERSECPGSEESGRIQLSEEVPIEDSSDEPEREEEISRKKIDKNEHLTTFRQLLIGFGLSPDRVERIVDDPNFNQVNSWQELREAYEKRMEEIAKSDSSQSALDAQIGGELVSLSPPEANAVLGILREGDFEKARKQAIEFLTTKYFTEIEKQGQQVSKEERMVIKTSLNSLFQAGEEVGEEIKEEIGQEQTVKLQVDKVVERTKNSTEKLKPILKIAGTGSILFLILMFFKGFSASRQ